MALKSIIEFPELSAEHLEPGEGQIIGVVGHYNMVSCKNSRSGDVVKVGRTVEEDVIVIFMDGRQRVPQAGAKAVHRVLRDVELDIEEIDCSLQQVQPRNNLRPDIVSRNSSHDGFLQIE